MGAYTSAMCYRAGGAPPIVRSTDLAHFAKRILAMDIFEWDWMDVSLKFGQAIDQDQRTTHEEEQVSDYTFLMLDYDWHVEEHRMKHADALALLQNPPSSREVPYQKSHVLDVFGPKSTTEVFGPHIYRASLSFGMLKEDCYNEISHTLQGNFLHLNELSFHIDMTEITDPQEPDIYQIGWIELSIHGSGYLFPWTYEEALARIRRQHALSQIRNICREMWPATTNPPSHKAIEARRRMGKLWAEPLDAPFDWYWAIHETY